MKKLNKLMLLVIMIGGVNLSAFTPYTECFDSDFKKIQCPSKSSENSSPPGLYDKCTGKSDSEHGTCPGKLYCVKTPKNQKYQKTKQGEMGSCRSSQGV